MTTETNANRRRAEQESQSRGKPCPPAIEMIDVVRHTLNFPDVGVDDQDVFSFSFS